MFHKIKFIMPLAMALLAGGLLASPAFAQRTGGAISGSGNVSAAPSTGGGGGHMSASPGPSSSAPAGGYRGGSVNAARGSGPARIGGNSNYAYNGRHHHHHRDHDGHFGFGSGFFGGPYDYDDSWAYEPDCYLRRVHIHHHWVLRRYCD